MKHEEFDYDYNLIDEYYYNIKEHVQRSVENINWFCEMGVWHKECSECIIPLDQWPEFCTLSDFDEIEILTRNPSVIGSDDENKDGENKDSKNEGKSEDLRQEKG